MSVPVQSSNSNAGSLRNFTTMELQILAVTSTTGPGAFTNGGQFALDCMAYNNGPNLIYLVFSTQAAPTALNLGGGASGTTYTTVIAPGAYVVIQKGTSAYFAAITDSGTATLYLHAGRGS